LLMMSLFVGCGGGGSTVTDEQRIVAANNQLRSRVATILNGAAAELGVAIETDNFASLAAPPKRALHGGYCALVNANIQGVQDLQIDDLRRGADVLFSFVQYEDGKKGFFVTRIREENGRWIATLRTLGGEVDTTDVNVSVAPSETAKPIKLTVDWDDGPCIDARWGIIVIKICMPMGLGDVLPLRLTQGGYEAQMSEAFNGALNTVRNALANRSRNPSQDITLVSRDDVLYASQIHAGVADWTIEEISQQPMMTCFIESAPRPDLSGRIRSVVIQQGGEGVWTAPNLPGTQLVIKLPSSKSGYNVVRLNDTSLEVITDIRDYEVGLTIPL